ncbi:hypothetical protein [Aestuariivirga sp.]|uniref:hypothetical protein n=1 Tax=Aestuariivirga sp. TaxID=2650926 RepID=UPI003593A98A
MLRTALIALTAAAAATLALAPAAQAKTNIDFNIGFGVAPGFYVGAPVYVGGYGYDDDCHYVKVKHKKVKANGKVKVWYSKERVCY